MNKHTDIVSLIGRVLLGVFFILGGVSKVGSPTIYQSYIAAVGLPLPVVAYFASMTLELVGGILLVVGFHVRIVAACFAVFCLATAAIFHNNFADQNQMIHFLKDIAILAGLLQVIAYGPGKLSLDHRFGQSARPSAAGLTAAGPSRP